MHNISFFIVTEVRSELESIGVDLKEVKGVRAPQLALGGSEELIGMPKRRISMNFVNKVLQYPS